MPFTKTSIPLTSTGQFSKLMLHYAEAHDALRDLYDYAPSIGEFEKIIKKLSEKKFDRKLLAISIKEQYLRVGISNIPQIDILNDPNTFTVCTGHQLCLFTGPLYFIYKIISTINLAEALKKEYPNYNFVPVYWMASEDHDFDEVKSIHLFGKTISWNNTEAKGAVGILKSEGIKTVLDELFEIMGDSENATVLKNLFIKAYTKQNNLADATRVLVHELFIDYPLLIIDGNNKLLKEQFELFIKQDLIQRDNNTYVNNSIQQLNTLGYKVQVNPREINSFYMKDNLRERIEFDKQASSYKVLNTSLQFTEQELLQELKQYPERFSPNVVMRPMYQQTILPNIAYVGGPAEIAYWLEYKQMFQKNNVVYPVLIPRNFAMLIEHRHVQMLNKFGFKIKDIFKEYDSLTKDFISLTTGDSLSIKSEEEDIKNRFNGIVQKALSLDSTLKAFAESEMQKVLKSIHTIEAKMLKAQKNREETSLQQLHKLKEKYFPQRTMQERYDNFIPYYLKYGKEFVNTLKEELIPFNFEMIILTEKEPK